jgi:hypothetical protein
MMIGNRGTLRVIDPLNPAAGLEIRSRLTQAVKNRCEKHLVEVIGDFGLLLKFPDNFPKSFFFPKSVENEAGPPFLGPAAEGFIFPMSGEDSEFFGELGEVFDEGVEFAGLDELVVAAEVGDGALLDFSLVSVTFDNTEVGVGAGFLFPDIHVITINTIDLPYMSIII